MTSSNPNQPKDRLGRIVDIGNFVRIVTLAGDWFDLLPVDERIHVESMIGEVFQIEDIDEHGHPWVSKYWPGDTDGIYRSHSVALAAQEMECIGN